MKEQKDGSSWVSNPRPKDGIFWEDDMVTSIPRLGNKTAIALRDLVITTVTAMATNTEFLKNSSICGISTYLQKITNAKLGPSMDVRIDHTKANNPYRERYSDNWKNEVKKPSALSPFFRITNMIMHICIESKRVMEGTKHRNYWFFYHDALSLMTS